MAKSRHCVGMVSWVLVLWCSSWCPFYFSNNLAEEDRAGWFILTVIWLSVLCLYLAMLWVGLQSRIVAFPDYKPYLVRVQITTFRIFFSTRVYAVRTK